MSDLKLTMCQFKSICYDNCYLDVEDDLTDETLIDVETISSCIISVDEGIYEKCEVIKIENKYYKYYFVEDDIGIQSFEDWNHDDLDEDGFILIPEVFPRTVTKVIYE